MVNYRVKQRIWSISGKFDIMDSDGNLAYEVAGSFLKIPKCFTISKPDGQLVAKLTKVMWQFLPKFDVVLKDGSSFRITKSLTFFKPRYEILDLGLEIQGNFWDMNFELCHHGIVIAYISQEWFKLTSTYNVDVYDDSYSDTVIALVVAIDYVKAQRSSSNSTAN